MSNSFEFKNQVNWLLNLKLEDLRSEDEITSSWSESAMVPLVSVICNTFSHKDYIEDAIKGFLIQETDFPFEIIIHDDASSDGTVEIIKKYWDLYPNIIKPIFQNENQYSKGKKPTFLSFPYSAGRYIAFCEGDDFWFNPWKLSRQTKCLEENPTIDLCIHSSVATNGDGSVKSKILGNVDSDWVDASHIIASGGGWCATSSIFVRRAVIQRFLDNFEEAPIGDLFIQCLGAVRAGAAVVPGVLSVYRMDVPGNWSGRRGHLERLDSYNIKMQDSLSQLLNFQDFKKYKNEINVLRSRTSYAISADYFRRRKFEEFSRLIRESVSYKFGLHYRQVVLFLFSIPLMTFLNLGKFFKSGL